MYLAGSEQKYNNKIIYICFYLHLLNTKVESEPAPITESSFNQLI